MKCDSRSLSYACVLLLFPIVACSAQVQGQGSGGSSKSSTGGAGGSSTGGGNTGLIDNMPDASGIATAPPTETPTEEKNCGLTPFETGLKPTDILLLLDRSASMSKNKIASGDTRAAAVQKALDQIVNKTQGYIQWGLKMWPDSKSLDNTGGAYCKVSDAVNVEMGLNNYDDMSKKFMSDPFDGDGTPTGAAVDYAARYLGGLKDGYAKYIVLATDGEPASDKEQNGCAAPYNNPDLKTTAVSSIEAAASKGFKTFVIGVNTESSANKTLNLMAQAGGEMTTPLATGEDLSSSKNTGVHYYVTTDTDSMVSALMAIIGKVSDCRFALTNKPPVPDNVVVKVTDAAGNLVRVPVDPTHSKGWDYTSDAQTELQVYGEYCDNVKAPTANNTVKIIFGCQGQIIP